MGEPVSISISRQDYIKSYGLFRYGRDFNYEDLRKEGSPEGRNSLAWFLTYGLVSEAILDGFDLIDETEEIVEWNDDFQEILKPLLPDIAFALGTSRLFGHDLISIVNDEFNQTYVRAFDPTKYWITSDKFGNITKAIAKETIIGADPQIEDYTWETEEQLKNIYHSVNRITKNRNQGASYLNPIWDELQSLISLNEQVTIYVIRNAAGQIIISAPASVLQNEEGRNNIIDAAKKTNSANGLLLLPQGDAGEKTTWTIQSVTQGFDPVALRQLWIQTISAYSGVPALRLEGAARNYSTADQNAASYIEVLQDIQDEYKDELLWLVERIAIKVLKRKDIKNIDLKFAVRKQLTEIERLEELESKLEILSSIMADKVNLKISLKTAKKLVDLKYEESDIQPEEVSDDASDEDKEDEIELPTIIEE